MPTPPGYVASHTRAKLAIVFLVLRTCVDVPLILLVPMAPVLVAALGGPRALDLVHAMTIATLVMLAVTATVFLRWFHRIVLNARAFAEDEVPYTPAEAVTAWFIPIVSLFRPYQITRAVERASLGDLASPSSLVSSWWAAYYGRLILRGAIAFATSSLDHGARVAGACASVAAELVAVGLAISLVRYIERIQTARAAMTPSAIAEVFR